MTPAELFADNAKFVPSIARRAYSQELQGYGLEFGDLVQVGLLALWEAAQRFDAARGLSFSTPAYLRVRGAMVDLVRQERGRWTRRAVPLPLLEDEPVPSRDDVFGEVADADEMEWLRRQLAFLNPRTAQVIGGMLDGNRMVDVARTLGVSPELVWKRRNSGLRALRAKVAHG